ncbi:hypothetical protein DFJ77DRAFT_510403 [Powellomyces hirtus]|nr:hypothetical protein DFJ77DRAFT_510403 [Powellomyces hirtus]
MEPHIGREQLLERFRVSTAQTELDHSIDDHFGRLVAKAKELFDHTASKKELEIWLKKNLEILGVLDKIDFTAGAEEIWTQDDRRILKENNREPLGRSPDSRFGAYATTTPKESAAPQSTLSNGAYSCDRLTVSSEDLASFQKRSRSQSEAMDTINTNHPQVQDEPNSKRAKSGEARNDDGSNEGTTQKSVEVPARLSLDQNCKISPKTPILSAIEGSQTLSKSRSTSPQPSSLSLLKAVSTSENQVADTHVKSSKDQAQALAKKSDIESRFKVGAIVAASVTRRTSSSKTEDVTYALKVERYNVSDETYVCIDPAPDPNDADADTSWNVPAERIVDYQQVTASCQYKVKDRVYAQYRDGNTMTTEFYKATIKKILKDNKGFEVEYADGDRDTVQRNDMFPCKALALKAPENSQLKRAKATAAKKHGKGRRASEPARNAVHS